MDYHRKNTIEELKSLVNKSPETEASIVVLEKQEKLIKTLCRRVNELRKNIRGLLYKNRGYKNRITNLSNDLEILQKTLDKYISKNIELTTVVDKLIKLKESEKGFDDVYKMYKGNHPGKFQS